ncbi:MAG: class I SAM-dependent methyltransferase [Candidatus Terrybacteria bacterium]|nr:class I SAM-dependent methyltransferase [Candidatus Terrybacteria bacterium]
MQFIRKNDLLLDIGCGYGRAIKPIVRRIAGAICLDANIAAIRDARKELKAWPHVRFIVAEAQHLPLTPRSADVVVILGNTFGNLGSDGARRRVLSQSRQVLVPGGRIAIGVWRDTPQTLRSRLSAYEHFAKQPLIRIAPHAVFVDGTPSEAFSRRRLYRTLKAARFTHILIQDINAIALFATARKPILR